MGALWEPFRTYNIERARSPAGKAAKELLLAEFGLPAIPVEALADIRLPTSLIWGRTDLATPLSVAEDASARYGWPLQVIEDANDDPPVEQPEAVVNALDLALRSDLPRRDPSAAQAGGPTRRETVDTLVIGGGQAGLATSYWLKRAGVEHLVIEAQHRQGGTWRERWDSFRLIAPNFTLTLPGMPYAGPEPEGFMPRDQVVNYVEAYGACIEAPFRLGTRIERLTRANGGFEARSGRTIFAARNVVLATGPYQKPKVPDISRFVPSSVLQLHSRDYRRPSELPGGAVLVVGTGQSGTQIANELHHAGREVHLSVSMCWAAPRRYRGHDLFWWMMQSFKEGARLGVHFPTVDDLPSPAARLACNPHVFGKEDGRDRDLRHLARRGVLLYGRLESIAGNTARFTDDLEERLAFADRQFSALLQPMFDAYISAAGISAPPAEHGARDDFRPQTCAELDLDRAGVTSIVWATGYRLDFSWVDALEVDEWQYPRHVRGVTTTPGLYVVGLPWLHSEPSSVFAGVGADAAHVVDQLVSHRRAEQAGCAAPSQRTHRT